MCEECGINKIHQLDECDILKNKTSEINLLEWKNIPRQGKKKNGNPNTQLELTKTVLEVKEVFNRMKRQYDKCRKHLREKNGRHM